MAESVMVAVRCRPFNKREVAMGSKVIVQMNGAKTTLLDPSGAVQPKEFTFDFSYWSFDAAAPNFATNPKVYSDLGVSVLNNAWLGFNCCLEWGTPVLTSSGKSILIEEVTTEHELLGPDGKARRVEAVDTSLVRPKLVEVSDADGRSYRVTLDHQLTFVWSRDPVWTAVPDEKCISVVCWNKHASAAHPIGERLTFSQRYCEPELPQSECNNNDSAGMSFDRAVEQVNLWLGEHSLRSGDLVEVLAEDFLRRWAGLNGADSPDVAAHGVALAAAVLPDLDLASNLPVAVRPVRLNEPRLISQKAGDAPFQVVEIQVDGDSRYVLANGSVTHNCLFAYGQTGSGKSYSMVGYGEDKGIVPQAMEEMFARINRNKDKNVKFSVEASMMEIYNEKVRDLFNPDGDGGGLHGLKVRDNPQTGPYVEGLSRTILTSYKEFEHLLNEGNAVRTVAATQMNATSSRAHTVFQIVFTTTTHDEETNKSSAKTSKINLVDLAGSERLSKTGATGQQMKEGVGINKSLTALGNVIEKLAKKSSAKKGVAGKAEVHVPYRDSVLTWLLKESLGGNAKTIMIAAISPADDNYDESLSTLRYADRAKQIKNSAVVNEDENGRIIRELKKEIQALRDALAAGGSAAAGGGGAGAPAMSDQEKAEYLALKEQMKQNEELVARMNMSWEDKLKESEELAFKRAAALHASASMASSPEAELKKKKLPYMVNLHKDKLLSEQLHYFFPSGKVRLCTKAVDPPPGEDDIVLSGLQIKPNHAVAEHEEVGGRHALYLTPGEGARVFLNGKLIKERTEVEHNDRLICGAHLVFRFIFPNHAADDQESIFDWEYANKELTTSTIEALNKPDEETLRAQAEQAEKMAKMQAEIESERQKARSEQEARQKEYEQTLREIAKKKEEEIAATKKQIEQSSHADSQKVLSKKLAEREAELERERAAAAKLHSERLEAMKKEQAALEAKLAAQQQETQALHKKHQVEKRDRALLEENLMHVIPLVNEANAICSELAQPLRYNIKLEAKRSLDDDGFTEHTDVWIRVTNLEDEVEVVWDMETLSEALYLMREIYNEYMRSGEVVLPEAKEDNPFHLRPSGPTLIGTARLYLQPCFFLLPINESTAIIDYRGEHKGQCYVNLVPIPPRDEDTMNVPESDLFFEEEELTELKGEPLTMRLEIKKCMGLPQKYSSKVFVKYRFFYDSTEHQTEACGDTTINPLLNYERTLLVDIIEDEFVEYVKSGVLELSVYGEQPVYDDDDEEKDGTAGTASTKAKGGRGSKRATAKAGSSKRNSMTPGDSSSGGGDASARIAKLEAVLRDITASVAPDASADSLLKDAPEELVGRVKDLVVKKASLEEENFVLKSPEKARPASSAEGAVVNEEAAAAAAAAAAALQVENEKIKAELESLRSKGASASGAADAEAAALRAELEALRQAPPAAASAPLVDENASLKAALESLKSKATPSASELAELRQSKEAQERALAAGEAELAALRATLATKENEAAELRALQEREATLNRELQEKLGAAKGDEDLASLRKELDSARAKVAAAGQSADRDAELEELRRQLKEEQEKKKSSACVIL